MTVSSLAGKTQTFFFNASDRQLFGAFHPNAGNAQRRCGIVLCYPLGDEYIRSHRSFLQLAARLSRLGFPVLRFDYYGLGDSAGDDTEATYSEWLFNTSITIDQIKSRANVDQVVLMGLRLGASIAAAVAAQRNDVLGMVLWEPIVEGKVYLNELSEAHEHKLYFLASQPAHKEGYSMQTVEYLGFRFSEQMLSEISNVNLLVLDKKLNLNVLVIESSQGPQVLALSQHLKDIGASVDYQVVESPVIWAEDPDKALVPHQLLQAIVTWTGQQFR